MKKVNLHPVFHRANHCIGISFDRDKAIECILKKEFDIRWSKRLCCWYIKHTAENRQKLYRILSGMVELSDDSLKQYLQKKLYPVIKKSGHREPIVGMSSDISGENIAALEKYKRELVLKSYSKNTCRTYINEFCQFLKTLNSYSCNDLTNDRLKDYFTYCAQKLGLSENTIHSRINAVKFYYEQVLQQDKLYFDVSRPKKPLQLPKLLNEDEIRRLFNALSNKKHKAMLFTVYSAGLRVSELTKIRLKDIDSTRMQIFIDSGKGKKDRYITLSRILLYILRKYIAEYEPRPGYYLFESEQTGQAYPIRTVQQIFSNAKKKAGITKDVGIHSLRHSFATHLLEKGTDIYIIKDLLGHFDIRTTERYLHISNQELGKIVSPFDDLFNKGDIDW